VFSVEFSSHFAVFFSSLVVSSPCSQWNQSLAFSSLAVAQVPTEENMFSRSNVVSDWNAV
jgi:hypothetical protein